MEPLLVGSNLVPLHIGQEFTEISDIVRHKVTENHSLVNVNQLVHFTRKGEACRREIHNTDFLVIHEYQAGSKVRKAIQSQRDISQDCGIYPHTE